MPLLYYLIPLLLIFEIGQLVVAERFLGIKRLHGETDPRNLELGERLAFGWSVSILLSWLWMALMLIQPVGRPQAILIILITGFGFMIRRGCTLKWVLVVMTFEGALRVGMLLSLIGLALRRF